MKQSVLTFLMGPHWFFFIGTGRFIIVPFTSYLFSLVLTDSHLFLVVLMCPCWFLVVLIGS